MNADDRLSVDPAGRIEGRNGGVEGRCIPDVRPQTSLAQPLDDPTQLDGICFDNKVDCRSVSRPGSGRTCDGHQRSSRPNQACGLIGNIPTENIENQIDSAEVLQLFLLKIEELAPLEIYDVAILELALYL